MRIFLSHSSENAHRAIALRQWLIDTEPALDGEIFLALDPGDGIQVGTQWKAALRNALDRCEAVICLVSEEWLASHECRTEFRTAENAGKRIFSARLSELRTPDITEDWHRCDLFGTGPTTSVTMADGTTVSFLSTGLARLLEGLRLAGIGAENFAWPPPGEVDRSPYRGWRPFEAVDAAVYFGRDAQTTRAIDTLRSMRSERRRAMLVILGPSGTGKSSFLRAGLLPRTARDDRDFTVLDTIRPERAPISGEHGLAVSLHRALTRLRAPTVPTLGEIKRALITEGSVRLQQYLDSVRAAARSRLLSEDAEPGPTPLIAIDQAEELLSADAGPEGRQFLTMLGETLGSRAGSEPLIVICTIRTDRYQLLQSNLDLADVETEVFDRLKPLPPDQFRAVITGPAIRSSRAGRRVEFEPALVDLLIRDCSEGTGSLPLLALVLSRLYEDYSEAVRLTVAHYRSIGGIEQVVNATVSGLLSTDPAERQDQLDLLRQAFVPWLVTVADTDQLLRRIARWTEIPREARALLDRFVDVRMLVKDQQADETTVEVAVEALFSLWPELASWLDERREDLRRIHEMEQAAASWERNGRHAEWLWAGTRLAEISELLGDPELGPRVATSQAFLAASRKQQDRLRQDALDAARRRNGLLAALLVVTLVIAISAIGLFVKARNDSARADREARGAVAAQLLAQSKAMLSGAIPGGDVLGLQLAQAAFAVAGTNESIRDGATDVALRRIRMSWIAPIDGAAVDVAFNRDGTEVAVTADDGIGSTNKARTVVAAADSGATRWQDSFTSQNGAGTVSFGDDGQVFTSTLGLGIRTRTPHRTTPGGAADGTHKSAETQFSSDGTRAVDLLDRTFQVWDPRTGRVLCNSQPYGADDNRMRKLAISRDGRTILTTTGTQPTMRLWDAGTCGPRGDPAPGPEEGARRLAISSDGEYAALEQFSDGALQLRRAGSGELVYDLFVPEADSGVSRIAFSPDGRTIAAGTFNGTIHLLDTRYRFPVAELRGHSGAVTALMFDPSGTRLVSAGNDRTLRMWDLSGGMVGHPPENEDRGYHDYGEYAIAPNGRWVAHELENAGGSGSSIGLFDLDSGSFAGMLPDAEIGDIHVLSFSPDGGRLLGSGTNGTRVWKVVNGGIDAPARISGVPGWKDSERFSLALQGSQIAFQHGDSLTFWDVDADRPVGQPIATSKNVRAISFSPDGNLVAVHADSGIDVYEVANPLPRSRLSLDTNSDATAATFVTNHSIAYYRAGAVRIWEIDKNSATDQITMQAGFSPTSEHISIAVTQDGRSIAAVARTWVSGYTGDGAIRIWNTETGRLSATAEVGVQSIISLKFADATPQLVALTTDGLALRVTIPSDPLTTLCQKVTSRISEADWHSWVSSTIPFTDPCS